MNFAKQDTLEDSGVDINLTPLIDIVFLLLIFFMVSTTFTDTQAIKVNLPATSKSPVEQKTEPLVISISRDGKVYFKGEVTSIESLGASFSEESKQGLSSVIIRADEKVDHGKVVEVMETARSAGITKLSVATKPK